MIPSRKFRTLLAPVLLMAALALAAVTFAFFVPLNNAFYGPLLAGFMVILVLSLTTLAISFVDLRNLRLARAETTLQLDRFQGVLSAYMDNNLRDQGLLPVGRYLASILQRATEWRLWLRLPPDLMRDSRAGLTFFSIGEPEKSLPWACEAQEEFLRWSTEDHPDTRTWEKRLATHHVLLVGYALPNGSVMAAFLCPVWPSALRAQMISIALTQLGHFIMGLRAQVIEAGRLVDSEFYGHVVSVAVHEIARELQLILERLKEFPATGADPDRLAPIFRNLQRSALCLEWVRQWKQVDQDFFHVAPSPMPLRALLEDLELTTHLAWPQIAFSMRGELDVEVLGDPQLFSVFQNIVFNAAEAGPEYSRVDLEVVREGRAVMVYISDEGPGIARGNEDRIFQALISDQEGKRDGRRGTGIGLFLSRRIAQALGGDVLYCGAARPAAEGRPPGARFAVRLLAAEKTP